MKEMKIGNHDPKLKSPAILINKSLPIMKSYIQLKIRFFKVTAILGSFSVPCGSPKRLMV
jgi:hypothetical protein